MGESVNSKFLNQRQKRNIVIVAAFLSSSYLCLNYIRKKKKEHSRTIREQEAKKTGQKVNVYERKIKCLFDKGLSFIGLVLLAPVYIIIAIAIFIDDPGPVLFAQKRVGKGKELFMLHKFRSMKMSTPHDVPTHQLQDPEQYITRVGRILRKTSLDELPQLWDIFRGKMSIIGPRPALWNQDDLVAERDKYGANDILPGLTGFAQINGRDELEIAEKARLDGEYVKRLKQGSMKALFFDAKCFFGTITSVAGSKGVVEGGTGEMKKDREETIYNVSVNDMYASTPWQIRESKGCSEYKKMLIVGSGSYIGNSVKEYLRKTKLYDINEIDAVNLIPESTNFKGVDTVFFVAGIVHKKETKKNKDLYYKVNRDLAVNTAKEAKKAGVAHFILLSSMSVYGMKTRYITKDTVAMPDSHYGRSKLQADNAIWKMRDEKFWVSILRPPMVYGKNCKGNYQLLRSFAIKSPFFLDIKNKRSMIYIGNLCAFVKQIVDKRKEGVFFPQNAHYVSTSKMVKYIATLNEKEVRMVKGCDFLIKYIPLSVVKKVFGSLMYEKTETIDLYDLEKSLEETEKMGISIIQPLVSITTATYNSEKTLARTIESVLNQTYNNIEYIIIDGLSKDKTICIAEEYRKKFEQKGISYRIISESDKGMYDAINKGIRSAKGEIIGNINSDDWYELDAVEKVVKKYNETQFDFMYGNLKIVLPDGRIKIKKAKKSAYLTSRHWNHPTQFATKNLYIKEPYKLESMYDDFDLFLRVNREGYYIEILKEPLANFTIEGMSHKRSMRDAIDRGRVRYRIYKNNGYSKWYLLECFFTEALKLLLG